MTQLTVRITGLQEVMTGFNKYAATLEPVTRESIRDALERARAVSPGYLGGADYTTPPPEGSAYVRTGNLGRSYAVNVEGLSVRLGGAAYRAGVEYGRYVVGDGSGGGQAWMHAGRWPTLRSAVDAEIDKLTGRGGELDQALDRAARESGLA